MAKIIFTWIGEHFVSVALVLSFFIQIAPIKVNPWTALFKWAGKNITSNLETEMASLKEKVNSINANIDENEKDRIRWEVLDFANSCRNGRKHSKDEFQHMIVLNDKYKELLARTGDRNGVFDVEYKYIEKLYAQLQESNDFLL